jgi:hypothetical protein
MGAFIAITDATLPSLLAAERAVLILAKSDCAYCVRYTAEIEALLARGSLRDVLIGKLILDRPGSSGFKRENPWLAALDVVPFTLLYRAGRPVDAFAASRAAYLLERLGDQPASIVA